MVSVVRLRLSLQTVGLKPHLDACATSKTQTSDKVLLAFG